MKTKIIEHFFKNKTLYKRVMYAIALIGVIFIIVLKDHSCEYKDFSCDSNSNVNIEVKK